MASRLTRAAKVEAQAINKRREWEIAPFRKDIEQIIQSWRKLNPASGTNAAMGISAKVGALRAYLEEHVIEKHSLPCGTQNLTSHAFSSPLQCSVNFDVL